MLQHHSKDLHQYVIPFIRLFRNFLTNEKCCIYLPCKTEFFHLGTLELAISAQHILSYYCSVLNFVVPSGVLNTEECVFKNNVYSHFHVGYLYSRLYPLCTVSFPVRQWMFFKLWNLSLNDLERLAICFVCVFLTNWFSFLDTRR